MSCKVAFIGLGVMGYPMAGYISKAGHDVTVYNRTKAKAEKWIKEYKGKTADTPMDAAKDCDFIFTCVGNDNDLREVTLGDKGLFKTAKKGAIYVDNTTASANIARELYKEAKSKGFDFLDAPISGGQAGAEGGILTVMVGGDQDVFNRSINILKVLGNPTLVGPIGSGQVSKLANQIIVGISIGAVAEAITLCEKAKVDPTKFISALSGGFADSQILQNHGKRMIEKDFTPKGKVSTHLKDMNNILECANSYNTHLPISNLVKEMYKTLVDNGHGNTDHSSLYNEIERINKK